MLVCIKPCGHNAHPNMGVLHHFACIIPKTIPNACRWNPFFVDYARMWFLVEYIGFYLVILLDINCFSQI